MDTKNRTKTRKEPLNPLLARVLVWMGLSILIIDSVYANIYGIHYMNREALCIVYKTLPRWLFLCWEFFVEASIVVLAGVFASVLIENYNRKLKRFFPKNQLLAFLYASLLPICSCGAIPLIEVMKQRVPLRVIITFIIAAPVLNPYIIILSISIMGLKYCIIRIIASFALAVFAGILVEWIGKTFLKNELGKYEVCETNCTVFTRDVFVKTILITKKLIPYIFIGGVISLSLELFNPKQMLSFFSFSNQWLSMLIMLVVGIPIFVCNGADIILLKPLLSFTDLSLGASMVFSLTSSAVCISSIVMTSKFLGKPLTAILVVCMGLLTLIIGVVIDRVI
jgi:uncharacterized membrane protein YraQ (UPF0718 family)